MSSSLMVTWHRPAGFQFQQMRRRHEEHDDEEGHGVVLYLERRSHGDDADAGPGTCGRSLKKALLVVVYVCRFCRERFQRRVPVFIGLNKRGRWPEDELLTLQACAGRPRQTRQGAVRRSYYAITAAAGCWLACSLFLEYASIH
jgi:hypothetical protein